MINLDELNIKTAHIQRGMLTKRLVATEDGKKYVFKANYGFVDKNETPTSFGEVFYSRVCKELGCNCVNAKFASMTLDGEYSSGAMFDYYWSKDTMEALSFGDIIRRFNMTNINASDNMVVDNIVMLTRLFAKKNGFNFDANKAQNELTKLAILDYFFAQTDRHRDNIEFLVSPTEIKFAPIFDNGFCFNLWRRQFKDEIIAPEYFLKKGSPQFLKIHNMEFHKGSGLANLSKQILTEMKNNSEIKKFVVDICLLDIDKILNEVYAESPKDFDIGYVKNCATVFKYRKHLLLNYQKNILNQNEQIKENLEDKNTHQQNLISTESSKNDTVYSEMLEYYKKNKKQSDKEKEFPTQEKGDFIKSPSNENERSM